MYTYEHNLMNSKIYDFEHSTSLPNDLRYCEGSTPPHTMNQKQMHTGHDAQYQDIDAKAVT